MTNSVSQNGNLDSWLPMPEVIAATGMSQRTIYRMVEQGKLRQASRPIPGRRSLPVFDPDEVAVLAESAIKVNPRVVPSPAETMAGSRRELPPMEFWAALIAALKQGPAQLPPAESRQDDTAESLARLRAQVAVTHKEAYRLGLSPAILSWAVKTGKIQRLPGNRYLTGELEALSTREK